jgi:hypothetical protein
VTVVEVTGQGATLLFTKAELMIVNNVLNEICNGIPIEDAEFETRLGVTRAQARDLLTQVNTLL